MLIGSAITIQTTSSIAITGATCTIINRSGVEVISAGVMTNVSGNTWIYDWQSLESTEPGEYKAIIRATNGVYNSVARYYFYMDRI